MKASAYNNWITLDTKESVWSHFYTVSPLVVIGTKENDNYDLAPKHMVTALGHDNYFGFVCTPTHSTYQNVKRHGEFSVSFIRPNQVVLGSLAASPRCDDRSVEKEAIKLIPTVKAQHIDALLVSDSYLYLECQLDRIVDGFGKFSLIAGKIVAAHVHSDAVRLTGMDEAKMINEKPMLAFLPYGRYAVIKETFSFPYPKNMNV